jgi:NTP pyrophosphatase (non-canonical NTP hydrolase)
MSSLSLTEKPTLKDYQEYVAKMIRERHFEPAQNVPKQLCMLMEECGELAKAARKDAGIKIDSTSTKRDVAHEAADVFIILLSLCDVLKIDLEKAFRDKEEINKKRIWK